VDGWGGEVPEGKPKSLRTLSLGVWSAQDRMVGWERGFCYLNAVQRGLEGEGQRRKAVQETFPKGDREAQKSTDGKRGIAPEKWMEIRWGCKMKKGKKLKKRTPFGKETEVRKQGDGKEGLDRKVPYGSEATGGKGGEKITGQG